jgi:hypothetical protein
MIAKLTVGTEKLTENRPSARFCVFPPRLYYGHEPSLQNYGSENTHHAI